MGRKMGEKRDREREREKAIDSKLKSSQTSSSSSLSPSLIVRRRDAWTHKRATAQLPAGSVRVCREGRHDGGSPLSPTTPICVSWRRLMAPGPSFFFSFFFIHPGAFIYFPFPADGIAFLTFVRSRCCVDRFLPPSCASAKPVVRAWLIDCIRYPMLRRDTSPLSHRRSGSNRRETQRKITVDTNLRRPVMSPSPNEKMPVI